MLGRSLLAEGLARCALDDRALTEHLDEQSNRIYVCAAHCRQPPIDADRLEREVAGRVLARYAHPHAQDRWRATVEMRFGVEQPRLDLDKWKDYLVTWWTRHASTEDRRMFVRTVLDHVVITPPADPCEDALGRVTWQWK